MGLAVVCLAFSVYFRLALGYQTFQDKIPNGHHVPHPCKVNHPWPGVGHEDPNGGGVRNKFGLGFKNSGFQWSKTFCQKDCDGDGRTNGQELGDPNCTWTPGSIPSRIMDITHPGICDPFDSDTCKDKNTFVSCENEKFHCHDSTNKAIMSSIDLTFPHISVPPTRTSYHCMTFDLPKDQDYHIVAIEPVISNHNVLRHMLLYGCDNSTDVSILAPTSCRMTGASNCLTRIETWTLGDNGTCFGNKAGFRIGKNGFTKALLRIHYSNPTLARDYTDSSGIRLHYQPVQPGVDDLAVLMTGQMLLQLPPGKSRVEQVGSCSSSCTQTLITKPAYVTRSMNHMHYIGRSMNVAVYRNGSKLADLANDETFSLGAPFYHVHNPPVQLLPGDEILSSCVFNTTTSKRHVYYGEAPSDETCYSFLTIYPKQALMADTCFAYGPYSECDLNMGMPMDQCDWVQFSNASNPTTANMMSEVSRSCHLDGFCRPECRDVLSNLKDHRCLKGIANSWITRLLSNTKEGLDFLGRLRSCPMEGPAATQCPTHTCSSHSPVQACNTTCPKNEFHTGKDGSNKMAASSAILVIMSVFFMFA